VSVENSVESVQNFLPAGKKEAEKPQCKAKTDFNRAVETVLHSPPGKRRKNQEETKHGK